MSELKNLKLDDEKLSSVSGGTEISNNKEQIQYGGVNCSECDSSDTEVHTVNGKIVYVKCFECGFEKHFS